MGYLLAGRGLPTVVVATMLAGLAVGGASTIGVAERAYSVGISAGWYNAAWAAGALLPEARLVTPLLQFLGVANLLLGLASLIRIALSVRTD